ncbi:MAG: ABC transporter permease, partial [Gemmatimonadales bacterium]
VLVESATLAVGGGLLGLACAWGATRLFVAIAPPGLPRLDNVGVDGPVLAVALALSIGVALVFGAFPAAMSGRVPLVDSLRERRDAGSAITHRARSLLVGAQVTVAIAVLVSAAVVTRSFDRLVHRDLGFRTNDLVFVRIGVVDTMFAKSRPSYLDAVARIIARIRQIPGVAGATAMLTQPFHSAGLDVGYSLPSDPPTGATGRPMIDTRLADEDYFRTFGIRLLRGRTFTADDNERSALVTVVDESLAREVWPGENPLGKKIGIGTTFYTVVGVVGQTSFRDYFHPRETWYVPVRQAIPGWRPGFIAVRTRGDPALLFRALRAAVRETEPRLITSSITTLDQGVDATMEQPRLDALLLGGFAGAILVLTALGLYSIAATYVREREFEIGLRIALGAQYSEVVRLVVRQGLSVVIVGAGIGLVVAITGAGVLRSVIYDVNPRDPWSMALSIAAVILAALVAFYLPVRRAARANPADALRAN